VTRVVTRARDAVQALVLSGGGAKGAYEVGVMKALFTGPTAGGAAGAGGAGGAAGFGLPPVQVYAATSVGAYNATFMASRAATAQAEAVARLEEVWRLRIASSAARCGNGVYRVRGLPLQGLSPGCLLRPGTALAELAGDAAFFSGFAAVRGLFLAVSQTPLPARLAEVFDVAALFSPEPLHRLVDETIDLDALRASPTTLRLMTANWLDGTARTFTKEDVTERYGTLPILASAAIPLIFLPVAIDGVPYADGGMVRNTPVGSAINAGANVVHVVYVDPSTEQIPFPPLPNTLDSFYRVYAILVANSILNDSTTVASINEALAGLAEARAAGVAALPAAAASRLNAGAVLRREREGRPYEPVTIHFYRPTGTLEAAAGLFDFREATVDAFIALGYEDTLAHDCAAAGCVLPGAPTASRIPGTLRPAAPAAAG
jgi:NTE family protein